MALFVLILKLFLPALIGLGAVGLMARFWWLGKQSQLAQPRLGVLDGQLQPCPRTPNCVSSQSLSRIHGVPKIELQRPFNEDRDRLVMILTNEMEGRVKTLEDNYVHLEFHSRFFRFVDDFEIFADPTSKTLEVRSASRAGHSDLGMNRKRVEKFRTLVGK